MTSDPLYAALLKERFGPPLWWAEKLPRPPDVTDARIQHALADLLNEGAYDELKEAV